MENSNITNAYIQQINEFTYANLKIPIASFKSVNDCKYLLVVQSFIENSIKLAIYPINKDKIIKVSLCSLKLSKKILKEISKILQKFQVIHTSGFLKIEKQLLYECYLNLRFSEKKSEDLKTSLEKIKNIFKKIKIEEIGLNNRKISKS
ncbi:MAG: hypothetical protein KAX18_08985 [Candidatus Lokiarchaeota archaeon]|jgi:hypothetical protein|nr:hypothetical protein [Candidatus Lokiarchaeota archaeon]